MSGVPPSRARVPEPTEWEAKAEAPVISVTAGAATPPLDVRDPDVIHALADAVAILGADFRPRLLLGELGVRAGFGRAELTTRLADWVHQDDYAPVQAALDESRESPGVDVEVRARVRNDFDGWHTMTIAFRNLLDHPDIQGYLVRASDHTVFEREARWRTLVGESPIGICEIDADDRCVFVNPAFARLTGIPSEEALGAGWCRAIHPQDAETMRAQQRFAADGGETEACKVRLTTPEGVLRWVSARWVPLRRGDGTLGGFLGALEDVTERQRLEERLEYDATHDRLTGLGSRALLVEELNAALGRARRGGGNIALLFMDLDGFKRVNDMLGHAAGDDLLVHVAQRLRAGVRDGDVCVRLGGDEFVVCCPGIEGAHASALAERLLAAVSEPYDIHGHEVVIGASVGIATARGDDPLSADQLLSNADLATYRAKRLGRGRVELFDEDVRRQLAQSRRIARSLTRVLEDPVLPIVCTPIAQLPKGNIVGFDCAVDWEPTGLRDADAIARVVEEAGLSRLLDHAMLRTIVSHLASWESAPPGTIIPGLGMALTRSGALSSSLPQLVSDTLAQSGVDPLRCWIGIPEAAVAHDLDAASRVVAALRDVGLHVALRDFGSAVLSLEQLRALPSPTITLAGPLVAAVREDHDHVSTALLGAIVKYAQALGRVVVASGVEDAAHAGRLYELGCEFGSGQAFGPTIPPDRVSGLLRP
jgi:diguanylate cyclase (GGDEF)-like protein/PAS domain S-box-containing protein